MFSKDNKICACSFSSRARGLPFSAHCRGFLLMIFIHRGSICCNTKTGQNLPQLKKKDQRSQNVLKYTHSSVEHLLYTQKLVKISLKKKILVNY